MAKSRQKRSKSKATPRQHRGNREATERQERGERKRKEQNMESCEKSIFAMFAMNLQEIPDWTGISLEALEGKKERRKEITLRLAITLSKVDWK